MASFSGFSFFLSALLSFFFGTSVVGSILFGDVNIVVSSRGGVITSVAFVGIVAGGAVGFADGAFVDNGSKGSLSITVLSGS